MISKKDHRRFNLLPFITNESWCSTQFKYDQLTYIELESSAYFTAVTDETKQVIGMVRTNELREQIKSNHLDIDSLLIYGALVISCSESPERIIDLATGRSDSQKYDDIILVDEQAKFLGLINMPSLLNLQKAFYTEQTAQVQKSLETTLSELENTQTDLKRASYRLSESQAVTKRLTEMRHEFVASLGSKARTPMTEVMGILTILLELDLDASKRDMLKSARFNVNTVLRLVESVLDFSRIESNALKLSEAVFSPSHSIERCVETLSEHAALQKTTLLFENHGATSSVRGDSIRTVQIFENLLCKALEQAKNGTVKVVISDRQTLNKVITKIKILVTRAEPTGKDELNDSDNPAMNQKSTELDDLVAMVSRRIAGKMGGVVEDKELDDGTHQATIQIPFDMLPVTQKPTKTTRLKETENCASTKNLSVLVIDDNQLNLEIIRRFLSRKGCVVHLADSGEEGLEVLSQHHIDGIFTDCEMPGISGYDVAQHIRSGESGTHYKNIFIAAITASDHQQAWALCDVVGIDYFIQKPVRANSFDPAIGRLVEHVGKKFGDSLIENAS